jgi:peptidoglycan L-alanyl-D-glutamate endopeptidase CwlK
MMDARSEHSLIGVEPHLCLVMRNAALRRPFLVIHGLRTDAEEAALVAGGHSQTMHSRHLKDKAGFAAAVDIAALADGHVTWEAAAYLSLSDIIKETALAASVPIEWGGDWTTLKDLGHFQLPWSAYP